jgi:hypothetical protein
MRTLGGRASLLVVKLQGSAFLLWLVLGGVVYGQTATGSLTGRVEDATGALIPGMSVTAIHGVSRIRTVVNSDASGHYRFSALPPGLFTLTVASSEFSTQAVQASVVAGEESTLNLELQAVDQEARGAPIFQFPSPSPCAIPLAPVRVPADTEFHLQRIPPSITGAMSYVDPPAPPCSEGSDRVFRLRLPAAPDGGDDPDR